jgi:hypothetical protein
MKLAYLKAHVGVLLVLIGYLALTSNGAWRIPLSVGPDEAAQFIFVRLLKRHSLIPLQKIAGS